MIQVTFGQATDPGLDPSKRVNEDSCLHAETPLGTLFVVCDGMGGHVGGKQASETAVRTIVQFVSAAEATDDPRSVLRSAIEASATSVYAIGGSPETSGRPGSTCVALLLHHGEAIIAHVGDSRCYGIRGEQIYQLTRDHSVVQQMLDNGVISQREAVGHPDANKITRALGMKPDVEAEVRTEPVELYEGDLFLLCTDGLTDMARDRDIMVTTNQTLAKSSIEDACKELVALANRRGGADNITVQLIRIESAGPKNQLNTVAESPPSSALRAGAPIPTTINDAPASFTPTQLSVAPPIAPTIVQTPRPPSIAPVPVDATRPTPVPVMSPHRRPPPIKEETASGPDERTLNRLIRLVYVLIGLIGILVAALLWATLLR